MKLHPKDRAKLEKLIGRITTEVFRHNLRDTDLIMSFNVTAYSFYFYVSERGQNGFIVNELYSTSPYGYTPKEYAKQIFKHLYEILNIIKNYGNTRKA